MTRDLAQLYITPEALSVIAEDTHNLIDTTGWWEILDLLLPTWRVRFRSSSLFLFLLVVAFVLSTSAISPGCVNCFVTALEALRMQIRCVTHLSQISLYLLLMIAITCAIFLVLDPTGRQLPLDESFSASIDTYKISDEIKFLLQYVRVIQGLQIPTRTNRQIIVC